MVSLSQIIVNKYIITDIKCHKLLSKDGVTTQDFVIDKIEGLFEGISVNIKLQRSRFPSIGSTSSIAKNLDEYQYIICSEIRSLPDSNSFKKELQKKKLTKCYKIFIHLEIKAIYSTNIVDPVTLVVPILLEIHHD